MKKIILLIILNALFLISYKATAQVRKWVNDYNGSSLDEEASNAIIVDASQNSYVTGYTQGASSRAFSTIKYNGSGVEQWVATFDPTINDDYANDLAIDGSGNIYVAGVIKNTHTNYGIIKYDNGGSDQWDVQFDGGDGLDDSATAIAVDAIGNVYVTGQARDSSGNVDIGTVKYNSSGVFQWSAFFNGSADADDGGVDIAVDGAGNVYVVGNTTSSAGGKNYVAIKYNSSGAEQWFTIFNGSGNGNDIARAVALDGAGNLYITGTAMGGVSIANYGTVKVNNSGVIQWSMEYNGTGGNYDAAYDIGLDGSGNVYVTGVSAVSGSGFYDYVTIKYSGLGAELWAKEFNGSGNAADQANGIAVDASGNVFVTGQSDKPVGAPMKKDYLTVMYDTNGNVQWSDEYDGPSSNDDIATDIALDPLGNAYVTGTSSSIGASIGSTTIKYCTAPAAAGTIIGDASVCDGETGVTYSVPAIPHASSYLWTLPSGATITSGTGTNTITVTFSVGSASGTLSVQGTNTCNMGIASPTFAITVNPLPPVPVINQSGFMLVSNASSGNQWFLNGTLIPGATSQNYTPVASGNYTVMVTNINGCSATSGIYAYVTIGIFESDIESGIMISPNPSSGKFIINTESLKQNYECRVLNILGKEIIKITEGNSKTLEIDLGEEAPGIYFLELRCGDTIYKGKMMRE